MKLSGWIFLTLAWGAIVWLAGFCLYELLVAEEDEQPSAEKPDGEKGM